MSETIYVPGSRAKLIQTKNGPLMKLSFKAQDLADFVVAKQNANGWVNFEVTERRTPSEKGDTHSVKLDTWQPTRQDRPTPADAPPVDDSEIPF